MLQGLFSRHTRLVGAVISALGIAVLSGAPARAALITTDACDNATLSQPFAQWNDSNEYKLIPGGSFENGASGWTLSHGAKIVSGSESFGATGSVGASSVYLPAGASVTSPSTCVDAAYPTFRFFARNNGLLSTVLVSVVYRLPLLGEVGVPVGPVALSPSWSPSLPMLTASVLTGLLHGGTVPMAVRFTAVTGSSQIDDVFVDPHMRY
ncbi:MAG TPA: hypothetical protein VHW96_09515 [Solirubrobacteraceae bacterium]|jgi:hypothetical protein|nr:hypothetical protein [Solirubrobacteraceae bacterium]